MKESAKLITAIFLTTMPCSALAARSGNGDTLQQGVPSLRNIDAQFAPAFAGALERLASVVLPAPSAAPYAAPEADRAPELLDVTEKWTRDGEVVSAFPQVYKLFQSYENARIIKVFSLVDALGGERRLEVYYSGGDWMQYGVTYIITNAGRYKDRVSVYPVSDLSTPDTEDGEVAPKIDPFDDIALTAFITGAFLDENCGVKPSFKSIASASVIP